MTFAQTISPSALSPEPLATGKYNAVQKSVVDVPVAPAPMAYLRLDTGEVIGVPAGDVAELHKEFDTWNRLMHEQLLANEVLALADERLAAIALAKGQNPKSISAEIEADARQAQGFALEWRDKATEAVRGELKRLDKLDGSGKRLVELIPLMEKEGDTPWQAKKDDDNGKWKREALDLKKSWGFKSGVGLRDHFKQEERYRGLGPLRVASSEKLKAGWPKFKDKKTTKWEEVYKKDPATGKRNIDRQKMRAYLGEQVTSLKLKSSDFVKLEINNTGTFGPEALANWNANAHTSKEGSVSYSGTKLADIDFSAEAAAMRYYSGGSLSAEIAPFEGNLRFKAEGRAEVSFAEGKMSGDLYLPSKTGVMLCYVDLEQVVDAVKGKTVDMTRYDMGAIRLKVGAELKGLLGVSLCGEVSVGVAMKDVEAQDVDGNKKTGRIPSAKGSRKKTKRANSADVAGKGDEWKNTAGLAAEVNFFVGVKGGLELKGGVEWRNPHSKSKDFEVLASIAPEIQGMAGLAGEAKLAVEYVDGVFRITAHAGICFGIGAEGTVSLAVGPKQLASFLYWMYYNLLNVQFRNLAFISKEAFQALRSLGYLLACELEDLENAIEKKFSLTIQQINRNLQDWHTKFAKAEACLALAERILANPERVRFTTPESKGMLIYQLTRHSAANWAKDGFGLLDEYLPTQRRAVLAVLEQTQIKSDLKNVIQHIHKDGAKQDFNTNLAALNRFFAAEGPRGLDIPGTQTTFEKQFDNLLRKRGSNAAAFSRETAMNGNFDAWFNSSLARLREDPVRGLPAMENSSTAYALQDQPRDHPLFASSEGGFYSNTA